MKGIPFSPEMALALREGRKSETRRVINTQPTFNQIYDWKGKRLLDTSCRRWCWKQHVFGRYPDEWMPQLAKLAKYNVGDVCYVQESWAKVPRTAFWHDQSIPHVEYIDETGFAWWSVFKDDWDRSPLSWKSPRFMPAWAARTFVEITSVRVERVAEITEEAALREGIRDPYETMTPDPGAMDQPDRLRDMFAELWNRLHPKAPYRFEDDPWVWVYGLKEVPRP